MLTSTPVRYSSRWTVIWLEADHFPFNCRIMSSDWQTVLLCYFISCHILARHNADWLFTFLCKIKYTDNGISLLQSWEFQHSSVTRRELNTQGHIVNLDAVIRIAKTWQRCALSLCIQWCKFKRTPSTTKSFNQICVQIYSLSTNCANSRVYSIFTQLM